MTTTADPTRPAGAGGPADDAPRLLDPGYRAAVVGLVTVVTVVAVEAMAVAAIMPTVARSLHGLRLYGWTFTAFLLADVVGMVDAGHRVDRRGPSGPLLGGLALFAVGLVVGALAPDMAVLLVGRVLQGLGGGAEIVAVYVVVARAFPETLRPKVFAATSAAWVVPAVVGPALAGLVTSAFGWRWVFGGIVPLAIIGVVLVQRVLRTLPPTQPSHQERRLGTFGGVALAVGIGLVEASGQRLAWWSPLLLVAGVAIGLPPLRALLPTGSLRLRRGLPTVVMLRGWASFAFFGAEAYLPLTLAHVHHGSATVVGIPLTFAALGWSAGSWWQSRGHWPRTTILRVGYLLVAIGVAGLVVVAPRATSMWLAVPVWCIAGSGMGFVMPTVSVLLLDLSPEAEQGANSAAIQVSDMIGSVLGIAAGGTVVSALGLDRLSTAIVAVDLGLGAVALVGALVSARVVSTRQPSG